MYKFVRCQTHPDCPDIQGWYLVLEPSDTATFIELHQGIVNRFFLKFSLDPHLDKGIFEIAAYNATHLSALWLQSIEKLLFAGTTVAVNPVGGILPLADVKVLSTIESQTMSWPDIYENERITISRWPECSHYYLSSNKNRVFVPAKYVEYWAAHRVAKRYTDNILEKC